MLSRRRAYSIAAAIVVAGCGAGSDGKGGVSSDSGLGGGNDSNAPFDVGGETTFDPDVGEVGPVGGDCKDEDTKQVYVVTEAAILYRFAPATKTYARVGKMDCKNTAIVYSMGVDRSGTAWVSYQGGKLYKVSTKDASCVETSYAPCQAGMCNYGMGFSLDAPSASTETLYVDGPSSIGGVSLAKIDRSSLVLSVIAPWSPVQPLLELTGTGDAQLYAFDSGGKVLRVDRATAAILETKNVPGFSVSGGFAFAQWAGDFWLFTQAPGTLQARVYQFSWATGAVVGTTDRDLGDTTPIVGAGVSTCAPFAPIK